MHDEEILLFNTCADLVSLKRGEAFPLRLLGGKRPGDWVGVREFCQQVGIADDDLSSGVFAAWLPDPKAEDGYVVIVFYDDESKWSMAAHYNRGLLLGGAAPSETPQPAGAALRASAGATSPQESPAVEQ